MGRPRNPDFTERECIDCGETLPIESFPPSRRVCRMCVRLRKVQIDECERNREISRLIAWPRVA